ncbi:MAG: hypothetical protein IPF42_11290 [Candidatus Microthrix sp.]|nr:hypothetical protein [Candidatus Microthrix sp.]
MAPLGWRPAVSFPGGGGGRGGSGGLPIGKGGGILGLVIALAVVFVLPGWEGGRLPFNVDGLDLPGSVPQASGRVDGLTISADR